MLIAEERVKAHDFVDRFKLAVVSADPGTWVNKMFPNWAKDDTENEEETTSEEDLDLGDTSGTWVFENEDITPEEAERAMAEMMADGGGTITWDDLPEDDDTEGWM